MHNKLVKTVSRKQADLLLADIFLLYAGKSLNGCCIQDFFFIESDLISQNQSSFKPGDSCINQLLSITP